MCSPAPTCCFLESVEGHTNPFFQFQRYHSSHLPPSVADSLAHRVGRAGTGSSLLILKERTNRRFRAIPRREQDKSRGREKKHSVKCSQVRNPSEIPKMEAIASSLCLTHKGKELKPLKAKTSTSAKSKASCSRHENKLFKATQCGSTFKAAISQCCMELYVGVFLATGGFGGLLVSGCPSVRPASTFS